MRTALVAITAALGLLRAAPASAIQDDVPLRFDAANALFSATDPPKGISALSAARGELDIAPYLVGGDFHRWHGRAAGGLALLSSRHLLWRMGLSVQTVADTGNDIDFRLVRLFYEWLTAVELKLGDGVLWLGLRHRCSHGADKAVEDRILIRTNLELGYGMDARFGAFSLGGEAIVGITAVGQNDDKSFQPRALMSVTMRAGWQPTDRVRLLLGAGVGVALLGQGGN